MRNLHPPLPPPQVPPPSQSPHSLHRQHLHLLPGIVIDLLYRYTVFHIVVKYQENDPYLFYV